MSKLTHKEHLKRGKNNKVPLNFNGKNWLYLYPVHHITVELYLKTAFKLCVTVCKKKKMTI